MRDLGKWMGELLSSARRPPRAYSPFNRSPGLRRLPDDRLGASVVGSLLVHGVIGILILQLNGLASGPGTASITSVPSWVDLTAPESADTTRATTSTPAARVKPRPAPPAHAARSVSAGTRAPTPRPAPITTAPPPVPVPLPASVTVASRPLDALPTPAAPDMGLEGAVSVMPSMPDGDSPRDLSGVTSEAISAGSEAGPEVPSVTSAAAPQPARTLTAALGVEDVPMDLPTSPGSPSAESPAPLLAESAATVTSPVAGSAPSGPTIPEAPASRPDGSEPSGRPRIHPVVGEARRGVAGGASLGRARVRFDGPRARITQRDLETVTGSISFGSADRVVVYVNETPSDLVVGGDGFRTPVRLQPGANRLRAVATGPDGIEAEDSIAIDYAPAGASARGVALTSPADGTVVTPEDPPVVVVEGRVEDRSLTTLWLVINDRRIPVRASEGRFRRVVPMVEPVLRIRAETGRAGEVEDRSQLVTVRALGRRGPSGVLLIEWPSGTHDLDAEVSALWRPHPDRLDERAQPVRLAVLKPSGAGPADTFWLRNARAGAYTIVLRYRGLPPDGELRPTLYVPEGDGLGARPVRPIRLEGSGKAVLARALLPQGVLWEQNEWFSGSSESVDTVIKFRFPEGINWVERKVDLQ